MRTLNCDGCGTHMVQAKLTLSVPLEDWDPGATKWDWENMEFCQPCTRELFVNMRIVVARLKEQRT